MHAYDEDEFDDELPELPIPRPGEEQPAACAHPVHVAPIGNAGGASFTAADAAPTEQPPTGWDDQAAPPPTAGSVEEFRFTWEIAATLTQGMLANPSRSQDSVKDAMAIFDQFIAEVDTYVRIRTEGAVEDGPLDSPQQRRSEHGEYFQQAAVRSAAEQPGVATPATRTSAPQPIRRYEPRPDPRISPVIASAAEAGSFPAVQPQLQQAQQPQPQLPRPTEGYRPLPPGARYIPGSMAGVNPDTASPDAAGGAETGEGNAD